MSVRLATKNGLGRSVSSTSAASSGGGGLIRGGQEGLGAGALEMETDESVLPELTDKWTLVTLVVEEALVRCSLA